MLTEQVPAAEPAYDDVAKRTAAQAQAQAEVQAQTEAFAAVATERGIQCALAKEIIDLWFVADWEPAHLARWNVLSGDQRPTADAALALVGTCLGFAPAHDDK